MDEQMASPIQRFATFLLDTLFIELLTIGLGFFLVLAIILAGREDQARKANFIFSLIFPIIYYSVQEAINGRTLGKYIMGTRAVKADGTKLSPGQAILRTLCRFIPFDIFSFLGGEGPLRGWHDKLSGTIVISTKNA